MDSLTAAATERLSTSQLKIYNELSFEHGLKLAEAAAGAGKTRTLSFLVLKALVEGKNVSILTSTRTAKNEAFARVTALYDELKIDCAPLCERSVKTIHSHALRFARDDAAQEGLAGVEFCSPKMLQDMLEQILAELQVNADYSSADASDVASIMNMSHADAAIFLAKIRQEWMQNCIDIVNPTFGPTAREAFVRLVDRMASFPKTGMRLMDFNLMTESLRASGRPLVFPGDVLFVDEAQDLSRCQMEILLNTLAYETCIVVLGDDSQGIFQFSGACDRTLFTLKAKARKAEYDVQRFSLMTNHRSSNAIVKVAESLLPVQDKFHRVGVKGNGIVGAPPQVLLAKDVKTEAEHVGQKVVALLRGGRSPGEMLFLRHKNWQGNDTLLLEVKRATSEAGFDFPIFLAGQEAANTLQGKIVAFLQLLDIDSLDVEDGWPILRDVLKSLRGSRGFPVLAMNAVKITYERHASWKPLSIFTAHAAELIAEFKLAEAAFEAEQTEKEARKLQASRKRKATTTGGATQKLANFKLLVGLMARLTKHLARFVTDAEKRRATQNSLKIAEGDLGDMRKAPPPSVTPNAPSHASGKLVWLLLRDVVAHEYGAGSATEIAELVARFDVPFRHSDVDFAASLAPPLATLSAQVHDKNVDGKAQFSTIHKKKGTESPVVFLTSLTQPWARPQWPQRACLAHDHEHDCTNRSGEKESCCTLFKCALEKLCDSNIAEKLRLYYVGASRAKELLFLSALPDGRGVDFAAVARLAVSGVRGAWADVRR